MIRNTPKPAIIPIWIFTLSTLIASPIHAAHELNKQCNDLAIKISRSLKQRQKPSRTSKYIHTINSESFQITSETYFRRHSSIAKIDQATPANTRWIVRFRITNANNPIPSTDSIQFESNAIYDTAELNYAASHKVSGGAWQRLDWSKIEDEYSFEDECMNMSDNLNNESIIEALIPQSELGLKYLIEDGTQIRVSSSNFDDAIDIWIPEISKTRSIHVPLYDGQCITERLKTRMYSVCITNSYRSTARQVNRP